MSKANVIDLNRERRIQADFNRLGELLAGSSAETTNRTHQYLQGELPTMTETEPEKNDPETIVISIRVSPAMNAKLLALAGRLSTADGFQTGRTRQGVTKASVIREALTIGVDSLIMLANGQDLMRKVASSKKV